MTWTVDDFLGEYEAPSTEVEVCPRAELVAKHQELERRLVEAGQSSSSSLADDGSRRLAEQLQAVETEMSDTARRFRFRALSRRAWRDLLSQHPPRKQDKADQLDFNPETFPVAAIAACALEPAMTAEQASLLEDRLPLGQFQKLWGAVLDVNLGVSDTPKSVLATAILRMNGASSTSAASAASPEASS
jgi:hypothetical protein